MDDNLNIGNSFMAVRSKCIDHHYGDKLLIFAKWSENAGKFELWPQKESVTGIKSNSVIEVAVGCSITRHFPPSALDIHCSRSTSEHLTRKFEVWVRTFGSFSDLSTGDLNNSLY